MSRGTVHRHLHTSEILADNALGDPVEREIFVYTPPGWSGEPLPAAMALAGFSGSTWSFLNRGWKRASLPERLDGLIAAGMPPLIVVIPDVMSAVGGTQFIDSPGIGAYGSWLTTELRADVASRFATTGRWGVFGKSSGGYGALTLPMDFPGRWHAAAAHSPDAGFAYSYLPDFPGAVETIRRAGGLEAWWADFRSRDEMKGADHAVMNLLGMSCAYSPDPKARPLPCRLPVDLETGAMIDAVFALWRRHDPVERVPAGADALEQLDGLWLDVGTRDEFRLQVGARLTHRALKAAGVPHEYSEHGGGHFKLNSRMSESLPWMARVLRG